MTLLESNKYSPDQWLGDLPVSSRYSFGVAGERFFREIKENGRIFGTYCENCDHTYVPASMFCERCLSKLNEWIDVGTQGEIHTFTHLFENYDGSNRDTPQLIAFVHIADGGIVHLLGEVSTDEVYIGMPVEVVFKPKDERKGSILDIKYFKPVS